MPAAMRGLATPPPFRYCYAGPTRPEWAPYFESDFEVHAE
jgi:hypothetical protein